MELYEAITQAHLTKNITFELSEQLVMGVIRTENYKILQEICEIIRDDTLDDPTCFCHIEKIVEILEEHGIACGGRHDFG